MSHARWMLSAGLLPEVGLDVDYVDTASVVKEATCLTRLVQSVEQVCDTINHVNSPVPFARFQPCTSEIFVLYKAAMFAMEPLAFSAEICATCTITASSGCAAAARRCTSCKMDVVF